MVDNASFVRIEFWMTKLGIKDHQLIIYAIIHGFSRDGHCYTGSQRYFREWTGKAKSTVIEALNDMKKRGLIVVKKVCIDGKFYNVYYTVESRKPESERLINQNPSKIISPDIWSEIQTGPETGPDRSENQTTQVQKSDQVGPKSGHNNIANKIDYIAVDSMEVALESEEDFADSAVAALITKKINEQFKSVNVFDKKFVGEIEKAILDAGMTDNLIGSYLDSVYERTISKNPSSIPGLYRKLAAAPDVIQNFMMHLPKKQEIKMIVCPVCGKEIPKTNYLCPVCGTDILDFGNVEKVQFKKAIFNLSDEEKISLENELYEVVGNISLSDFRNPQVINEREEKTRLVYAKYGIKYVAA